MLFDVGEQFAAHGFHQARLITAHEVDGRGAFRQRAVFAGHDDAALSGALVEEGFGQFSRYIGRDAAGVWKNDNQGLFAAAQLDKTIECLVCFAADQEKSADTRGRWCIHDEFPLQKVVMMCKNRSAPKLTNQGKIENCSCYLGSYWLKLN